MSIASEISRLTGLRNSIRTKLISLGLIASRNRDNADLEDCKDAIESINEYTPYLMTQAGIQDVAGFKYAQIDQTAWQPIGEQPTDLCSLQTNLGENGIESTIPSHTASIGTVYPPHGYRGIWANALAIDTDVIKPENIKAGVKMLGVTGTHHGYFTTGTSTSSYTYSGNPVTFDINVPQSRLIYLYLESSDSVPYSSGQIRSMFSQLAIGYDIGVTYMYGSGNSRTDSCPVTETQVDESTWRLAITPPHIGNFIGGYRMAYAYLV